MNDGRKTNDEKEEIISAELKKLTKFFASDDASLEEKMTSFLLGYEQYLKKKIREVVREEIKRKRKEEEENLAENLVIDE